MPQNKLLLTAVFGPYGVKDEYGEELGCQMELLNNQITREQGVHSPRQSYWSFGLYMMAENLDVPATVLDFPRWEDFTRELAEGGYTHVGISFIVPNVLKARRMARYIRAHHPEITIILGGYGAIIPNLAAIVPHDEVCRGEGVRWLRAYFGEDPEAPIEHPALVGPAYVGVYGAKGTPAGGILMPGLGCENGCDFCITSHHFKKCYVPLLETGQDVFDACRKMETQDRSRGFSVMDENFLKHRERARELLTLMEQHGKPYVFDVFSSAETILAMGADFLVRLGVRMVWVGVESKAYAHSKLKDVDLAALFEDLQSRGIVVQASAILFQDHHDAETMQDDIDWVIGLNSDLCQFMNYTPYPSTTLYKRLEREGRLKNVHWRHQHGQGELLFDHPHFPDPRDHVRLLRAAFRKKYAVGGPGVLNMAITALRGYDRARREHEQRQAEGLAWNPATSRYEPCGAPVRDEFMERRLRMMRRIALNLRPVIYAAWFFAPNRAARRKARAAMRLARRVLGPAPAMDYLKGAALMATGTLEQVRYQAARLFGREGIVMQPPMRRETYRQHAQHAPAQAQPHPEPVAAAMAPNEE